MNSKRLGKIIKYNREKQNITLKGMKEFTNLSIQKLSRIERGEVSLNLDDIDLILDELCLKEYNLEDIEVKAKELLFLLVNDIAHVEEKKEIIINQLDDLVGIDIGCILNVCEYYLALFLYYSIKNDKQQVVEIKKILENCIDDLEYDELAIYFDVCAVLYKREGKYNFAVECALKAAKCTNNNTILTLIYYHLGKYLVFTNEFYEALQYLEKCKHCSMKELNLKRYIYCELTVSEVYNKMRNYTKSILVLEKCYKNEYFHVIPIKYQLLVLNNLSCLGLLLNDYDCSIKYAREYLKYKKSTSIYFYLAYSYLQMSDYEAMTDWINESVKNCEAKDVNYELLKALSYRIKNPERYIVTLEMILNKLSRKRNVDMQYLVLKIIIEYYRNNMNYQKLSYYQEKYIELQDNHIWIE